MLKTLAERGRELADELREELMRVGVEQGERLRRLLEELLDLSRLDARAINVDPRPLVLKAAARRRRPTARSPARTRSSSTSPTISRRSSTRSCSSASSRTSSRTPSAMARRRSGSSAQQRDRHLRIAIEDAGPGIPKELEGRIFDRFARGGEAGNGLGLAIARAYAQAHGGDLVYDPRASGARFELLIPQERNGTSEPVGASAR